MAIGEWAIPTSYNTAGITANTNVRDVSSMLDLWAHQNTPVLNRVQWGDGSGGLLYEWISEHLGFGYVQTCAAVASNGTAAVVTTSGTGLTTAQVIEALEPGMVLYTHTAGDSGGHSFHAITTIASAGTLTLSIILATSEGIAASAKMYIIGHYANEGSDVFPDISRTRTILSNNFNILRKDIKITGSMQNTDMYAVQNELSHQVAMRLLEMQFERERTMLLSYPEARSSTVAAKMQGVFGFLDGYTGNDWVDNTTTVLTEPAFNTMVAACWENMGNPNIFVAHQDQTRKFTSWDAARIRTDHDERLAGKFVTKYLTDTGIEVDLVPMRKWPKNLAFLLDTSKMKLIPKKNRKLIMGQAADNGGDYTQYYLLSEFSFQLMDYEKGAHGGWLLLT